MHGAHAFLEALALVLGVGAVTSVLFQRLHQPIVLGYVLAGLIVGPYTPIPVIADHAIVQTLSELGVILLMFSLGLEFSLRKLFEVGFTAGLTALIETSIQLWLGFMIGRALGWSVRESIFCGAMVAISSTTIIAKAFNEQGIQGQLRTLVVGVLIVEDLIAILLMAVLTAMSSGGSLSWLTLAHSSGRLAAFWARCSSSACCSCRVGFARSRTWRGPKSRSSPASASASRWRTWRSSSVIRWRWARSWPGR